MKKAKRKPMATRWRAERLLQNVLGRLIEQNRGGLRFVRTFDEAGVMTTDRGLVVEFVDGTQVQITIVRSR